MAGTISLSEWQQSVKRLGAGEFRRRLRLNLEAMRLELVSQADRNAKASMRTRTSRLRGSIRSDVLVDGKGFKVTLQAGGRDAEGPIRYAGIQEFGGTVRAAAGRYLRVPLRPALTGKGRGQVDKFLGEKLRDTGLPWFAFKAKSGKLYLGRSDKMLPDGRPQAWYRLKKETKVKRKLFLGRAVDSVLAKSDPVLRSLLAVSLQGEGI